MTSPHEEGDPRCPLLFLGEAPSYAEIKLGRPLIGPSGDVFNQCLHTAGLVRREVYILNVWPFQVIKVKKGHYETGNIIRRDAPQELLFTKRDGFTEEGLQAARPTLEKIQRSGSRMIVAMGGVAQRLCLKPPVRPITKWRGSMAPGYPPELNNRRVLTTLHPAATLHGTYLWRYLIISDFEKAKWERDHEFPPLPQRTLIIEPTMPDILGFMHQCRRKGAFATDLEVINHQVNCFSLCTDPSMAMSVHIADENGKSFWSEEDELKIWLEYARLMSDPGIMKINQNIVGFDAPFLFQQNHIFTRGLLGDTMIAQHIMYPEFNKGLDFITSVHTREPYYKDEGKMWKGHGGDIGEFWRYNAKDAAVALESWFKLKDEMDVGGYWPTYDMTKALHPVLTYMSTRGFRVDTDELAKTHKRVSAALEEAETELRSVAEWDFNPGSPKQCQQYFYGTKGIQPYKGSGGTITTDDKAMARIVRRYNLPEARLVQKIRGLRKLKGTYLEMVFDKDNRLRCNWNPRGTWTGRLSSDKTIFGTGGNMQNLHPEFRHFLTADEEELQ